MKGCEEMEENTYVIPANYTDSGKLFGGMIAPRNAVETVLIIALLGYLEFLIPMPSLAKVITMVVTLIPLAMISMMGIDGDSLLQYIGHIFRHFMNRRKIHFRRPDDVCETK